MDGYGHRFFLYSSCPLSLQSLTIMMNVGFPDNLKGKTSVLGELEEMVRNGDADSVFLDVDITVLADALVLLEELRMLKPRLLIVVMVPSSLDYVPLHFKGPVVNVLLRRSDEGEELIGKIRDIFRVANVHSSSEPLDIPFAPYWKEYSTYDTGPELSPFELVVLTKCCEQKSDVQIALEMGVSLQKIIAYRMALQQKLGVSNVAGLIMFAIQKGVFIS